LLDPVLISADCNITFSEVIDICREKSDHNATKISLQIPNYPQRILDTWYASRCDNVFSNVFVTYGYGLDANVIAQA
jgi:hypothetical protein